MKFLLTTAFVFLTVISAMAQGAAPVIPVIEEVYLAKDDGEGRAGEQVTEFRTTDVPIYCVVLLETTAAATTVKMNFVAVNVIGVRAETKVVTASYITKEGQNRVNFTGRPDGKWTPGRYRVDLFVNGKLTKNVEFEIKGAAAGRSVTSAKFIEPAPAKPAKRPKKP